jgi:hypothetical protein
VKVNAWWCVCFRSVRVSNGDKYAVREVLVKFYEVEMAKAAAASKHAVAALVPCR